MANDAQPHIKLKKGDVEKYVLLPGDPARVKLIVKFLKSSRKINDNRGFLTYTGRYGKTKVSAMSTGMGCPSAAIAVEELAKVGAKSLIRIGTCGGLLEEMEPGDIVIADSAFCGDGTTREYDPNTKTVKADKEITKFLIKAAENLGIKYFVGTDRTHDAFYEPEGNFLKLIGKNFISSEMECSAVFLVSKLRKLRSGAILTVNTPEPPEEVKRNPKIVYRLVDQDKVRKGISNSIKIALEAVRLLEEK